MATSYISKGDRGFWAIDEDVEWLCNEFLEKIQWPESDSWSKIEMKETMQRIGRGEHGMGSALLDFTRFLSDGTLEEPINDVVEKLKSDENMEERKKSFTKVVYRLINDKELPPQPEFSYWCDEFEDWIRGNEF